MPPRRRKTADPVRIYPRLRQTGNTRRRYIIPAYGKCTGYLLHPVWQTVECSVTVLPRLRFVLTVASQPWQQSPAANRHDRQNTPASQTGANPGRACACLYNAINGLAAGCNSSSFIAEHARRVLTAACRILPMASLTSKTSQLPRGMPRIRIPAAGNGPAAC